MPAVPRISPQGAQTVGGFFKTGFERVAKFLTGSAHAPRARGKQGSTQPPQGSSSKLSESGTGNLQKPTQEKGPQRTPWENRSPNAALKGLEERTKEVRRFSEQWHSNNSGIIINDIDELITHPLILRGLRFSVDATSPEGKRLIEAIRTLKEIEAAAPPDKPKITTSIVQMLNSFVKNPVKPENIVDKAGTVRIDWTGRDSVPVTLTIGSGGGGKVTINAGKLIITGTRTKDHNIDRIILNDAQLR